MGCPILLTRDVSGTAHAFLNICRHRAAKLAPEGCGSKTGRFICPYHGWSYDLDGALRHIPDQDNSFPGSVPARLGLVPLPVEERHGFLWVVPSPHTQDSVGGISVQHFLGPSLSAELASYRYAEHSFYREESWHGDFNWKCGVEQFMENYHFAFLHRNSTNRIFYHNVMAWKQFRDHFRAIAPKRTISDLATQDEDSWDIRPHATILYTVFPLSVFFIEKSILSLLQIFPEAVGRSRVHVTYLVKDGDVNRRNFWEENIRLFKTAVLEDLGTCADMQKNFAAAPESKVLFGRSEAALHHYRLSVTEALARRGVAAAGS
jgi:phenylpropionate dioxygenase-like ring-hydroxylating dioxygenase large terminal subunit